MSRLMRIHSALARARREADFDMAPVALRTATAHGTWIAVRAICAALVLGGLWPRPALSSGWVQPVAYTWVGETFMSASSPTHLGYDYGNDIGTPVKAIAKAYDVDLRWTGGFGGCGTNDTPAPSGWALFLKHRKADGTYFWALYGHLQNAVSSLPIAAGQKVGEIADYSPCLHHDGGTWVCRTPGCPHLHFGIWDDPSFPTSPYGYSSDPRHFVDPITFMANNSPYPETGTYVCQIGQQQGGGWGKPGASLDLWIEYKNAGTATWTKSSGVSDPELHSVTGAWPCAEGGACAHASTWPSTYRICSFSQGSVGPGATGRYAFQGIVPASGTCNQWVAPWHGGTCVDGWATPGGANFELKADGAAPSASLDGGAPQPGTYQTDVTIPFTVSDNQSGVYGFAVGWDGLFGSTVQSSHGSTTLGAAGAGTHELWVRVWDNAQPLPGNTADRDLGQYVFASCPGVACPGRYIPNTCVPPTTCCPAATANLQSLPDLAVKQWMAVGQPVGGMLKPGKSYSIGFEYRAASAADLKIGLGSFNPSSELGTVINSSSLPPSAAGDWRPFWSAPFSVTPQQLSRFSNLRFIRSSGASDGLEIRNVRILGYQ